jgi:hypothetical protein
MKKNGTYAKSKIEDDFYVFLCKKFINVERQISIKGWPIDFYIKDINTYVQFDGVYWHGLNRSLDVIAEYKHPRDVQIHKKYLTDREQDKYFNENELKLIRVTDAQFKRKDLPIELT